MSQPRCVPFDSADIVKQARLKAVNDPVEIARMVIYNAVCIHCSEGRGVRLVNCFLFTYVCFTISELCLLLKKPTQICFSRAIAGMCLCVYITRIFSDLCLVYVCAFTVRLFPKAHQCISQLVPTSHIWMNRHERFTGMCGYVVLDNFICGYVYHSFKFNVHILNWIHQICDIYCSNFVSSRLLTTGYLL